MEKKNKNFEKEDYYSFLLICGAIDKENTKFIIEYHSLLKYRLINR